MDYNEAWKRVRSLFECPILDERKWAKVPTIPADAFILDLEDSVPPARKEEAREKVLAVLKTPEYFSGAMTIPRVNHLDTPWGRDDIIALAEAGVSQIMYPKTESAEDLQAVLELSRKHGSDPKLRASIESAAGVLNMKEIISTEEVVCVGCGVGDLHVTTGQPLYDYAGNLHPVHYFPKVMTVMTCAAYDKARLGFPQQPDIRDLDEYRKRADIEKQLGFNGCSSFYPPHVPILNEVFTPSEREICDAQEVIDIYEAALAEGRPAVKTKEGRAILLHQYKEAQNLLARVRTAN